MPPYETGDFEALSSLQFKRLMEFEMTKYLRRLTVACWLGSVTALVAAASPAEVASSAAVGASKAEVAVKHGALVAASAVEHGLKKAASAIERGASAAGHAIGKTAHKLGLPASDPE
jgi:hypothetical protein